MANDVFICHSSKDKKIADAICAKLEQSKIRCWIAPRDVVPGSDFAESIVEAIHTTKVTVFVFSKNSNVSPHVKHELERTVSLGLPVLPFRVDDILPSAALEYYISSAHWLDALTPPLEQHIDRLVTTVADLLELEAERPATEVPAVRPRRSRRTWVAVGAGAVAVVAAVVVGLILTLGGGTDRRDSSSGGPTTSSAPSATPSATPSQQAVSFVDDFTTGVDPGWTWTNEDPKAWRTTPQGWLEVDAQASPPMHNVLLRDAPGTTYKIRLRLRYPASTPGFAGIVLTGNDPESRLQFGWTETGLGDFVYRDGNLAAGGEIATKDMDTDKARDAVLVLEVSGGVYHARYLNPETGENWDLSVGDVDPSFTRLGVIAYGTASRAGTAAFDSFEIY